MTLDKLAALVFDVAHNGERAVTARVSAIKDLIAEEMDVAMWSEYYRGRADGAIEACKGLGGFDATIAELEAKLKAAT